MSAFVVEVTQEMAIGMLMNHGSGVKSFKVQLNNQQFIFVCHTLMECQRKLLVVGAHLCYIWAMFERIYYLRIQGQCYIDYHSLHSPGINF